MDRKHDYNLEALIARVHKQDTKAGIQKMRDLGDSGLADAHMESQKAKMKILSTKPTPNK